MATTLNVLIYRAYKREGVNTSRPYDRWVMEILYPYVGILSGNAGFWSDLSSSILINERSGIALVDHVGLATVGYNISSASATLTDVRHLVVHVLLVVTYLLISCRHCYILLYIYIVIIPAYK